MAGINFIRRYVMGQMKKTADDGIMITLPDSNKVDLNVRITMDRLISNGIDPDQITSPQQVENALNMINSRMVNRAIPADSAEGREITEKLFGKQKAPVFDMEGNRIPEGSGIMGGKSLKNLMESGQVTKGARGMDKSKKVQDREMFQAANERLTSDVDTIIKNIKSMEPITAMKEANSVIGRKGKYKNLTPEESKKILQDTEDHIFERDIPEEDFASGGIAGMLGERPRYQTGGDVAFDASDASVYGSSAISVTPETVADAFGNQVQQDMGNTYNPPLIEDVIEEKSVVEDTKKEGIMQNENIAGNPNGVGVNEPTLTSNNPYAGDRRPLPAPTIPGGDFGTPKTKVKQTNDLQGEPLVNQIQMSMMTREVKPAHWNKYAQDVIDTNGYPSKTLEQYVEEAGVKTNQTGILQAAPITNLPPALENRPINQMPMLPTDSPFGRIMPATPIGTPGQRSLIQEAVPMPGVMPGGSPLAQAAMANGGRAGFAGGGMGRRGFLKLLGSLGAGAAAIKTGILGLGGKQAGKEVVKEVAQSAGSGTPPPYFFKLVEKIKNLGDDVTQTASTQERQRVTRYKDYELTEDVATGRQEIQRQKVKLDDDAADYYGNPLTEETYMSYSPGERIFQETAEGRTKIIKTNPEYEEGTALIRSDREFAGEVVDESFKISDDVIEEAMSEAPSIRIKKASGGIARMLGE